jgi:hypothetical protein
MYQVNDKIIELQKQIEDEKQRISNCNHIFGKSKYDPETVREPCDYKLEAKGSDIWNVPTDYRDVTKDRWSKVCTKCGFIKYTNKTKPVIKDYEPDFD